VGTLDISANITLETGYKLSGYLLNPVGEPVTGAYVALDHFSSGWYSNNTGYYFTTAPAGIYTLTIKPRTGTMFPTYNENDFILIADTVKNFTLVTSTSTTTEPTRQLQAQMRPKYQVTSWTLTATESLVQR
jgi:hypothetical protein